MSESFFLRLHLQPCSPLPLIPTRAFSMAAARPLGYGIGTPTLCLRPNTSFLLWPCSFPKVFSISVSSNFADPAAWAKTLGLKLHCFSHIPHPIYYWILFHQLSRCAPNLIMSYHPKCHRPSLLQLFPSQHLNETQNVSQIISFPVHNTLMFSTSLRKIFEQSFCLGLQSPWLPHPLPVSSLLPVTHWLLFQGLCTCWSLVLECSSLTSLYSSLFDSFRSLLQRHFSDWLSPWFHLKTAPFLLHSTWFFCFIFSSLYFHLLSQHVVLCWLSGFPTRM